MTLIPLLALGSIDGSMSFFTRALPFLIYASFFAVMIVANNMRFSEHFEAGWCLNDLDDHEAAEFLKGVLGALLVRFLMIPTCILWVVSLAFGGWATVLDLAFATGMIVTLTTLILPQLRWVLPFSRKFSQSEAMTNSGSILVSMLILMLAIGAQFGLGQLRFGLAAGGVGLAISAGAATRAFLRAEILPEPAERKRGRATVRRRRTA